MTKENRFFQRMLTFMAAYFLAGIFISIGLTLLLGSEAVGILTFGAFLLVSSGIILAVKKIEKKSD